MCITSTVDPDSQTQTHAPSARQVARRLTRRNVVCEVQWAIPDVHCAVDLNCGYNAILQRHLHTRICQSPIPLPLTHCLLHMRPETAQTLLSRLPQTTNTWRMHSITPNIPTWHGKTTSKHANRPTTMCTKTLHTTTNTQSRCLSHIATWNLHKRSSRTCHKQRTPGACTLYYQIHLDVEGRNTRSGNNYTFSRYPHSLSSSWIWKRFLSCFWFRSSQLSISMLYQMGSSLYLRC